MFSILFLLLGKLSLSVAVPDGRRELMILYLNNASDSFVRDGDRKLGGVPSIKNKLEEIQTLHPNFILLSVDDEDNIDVAKKVGADTLIATPEFVKDRFKAPMVASNVRAKDSIVSNGFAFKNFYKNNLKISVISFMKPVDIDGFVFDDLERSFDFYTSLLRTNFNPDIFVIITNMSKDSLEPILSKLDTQFVLVSTDEKIKDKNITHNIVASPTELGVIKMIFHKNERKDKDLDRHTLADSPKIFKIQIAQALEGEQTFNDIQEEITKRKKDGEPFDQLQKILESLTTPVSAL